jgi:hypothetical protein
MPRRSSAALLVLAAVSVGIGPGLPRAPARGGIAKAAAILQGGCRTPAALTAVPGAAVPMALQQADPAPGMSFSRGVGGDERSLVVPEPATVVLLAAGVAITLLVRRAR